MNCCLMLVVCFSLFIALSSSTFISDSIFGSQVLSQRRLLQAKTSCPINFEFQNYTIITSKCKGPQYPPNLCCAALKDFACPFAEDLNNLANDCASTMFSYINLYGKYPPGLFASECQEGKLGLECPALAPAPAISDKANDNGNGSVGELAPPPAAAISDKANDNGNGSVGELLPMLILVAASFVLSMQFIWQPSTR